MTNKKQATKRIHLISDFSRNWRRRRPTGALWWNNQRTNTLDETHQTTKSSQPTRRVSSALIGRERERDLGCCWFQKGPQMERAKRAWTCRLVAAWQQQLVRAQSRKKKISWQSAQVGFWREREFCWEKPMKKERKERPWPLLPDCNLGLKTTATTEWSS